MLHIAVWTAIFAGLIVLSEGWLFAGLGLFWAWAYRLERENWHVDPRFRSGVSWLLLGVVVQILFPAAPGWQVGVWMTIFGWVKMVRGEVYL